MLRLCYGRVKELYVMSLFSSWPVTLPWYTAQKSGDQSRLFLRFQSTPATPASASTHSLLLQAANWAAVAPRLSW